LRRAQKLVPNPREVVPQLVQVLLAGDRADEALREVRELQKREPKFAGGWALEGDVLASQRKYAEAEKAYREALKLEPRANVIAIRLHGVLGSAGKSADAEALAKKWLADNPRDGGMRLYLAERELTARNYKAAAAQYQSLLSLEPNNAVVLNNLAWALGELGDARAVGYAERAVAAAPNNAMMLDTLGMLLAKKGETDKALTHLEQARKLAPERYDIRLNFARTLAKAGRKDAARKELQELQAVQADFPGKSDIPELLKSL
jgi:putative PEP-CTERM system TPR-repeat lipoprotein